MKNLLIVDSDPMFTTTLSHILAREQFSVTVAKDGKEAASRLAAGSFDLIITDMLMPYTNGLELINRVRSDKSSRHTPVMVISSVSNEQSISSWLKAGADSYFKKPLDIPVLLSSIKQLMIHEGHAAA